MSKSDRNFLEASLEGTEAIVDYLVENEAIKSVPVIGTAMKLLKGADDLRSKILQVKLQKFLTEPSLVRSLKAEKIKSRLQKDEQRQLIGEALFLTIDKVTDLQKPELLGRVFAAYLDEVVDSDTLLLLAYAIDTAFVGDLEYFLMNEEMAGQDADPPAVRLLSSGLIGQSNYEFTRLGHALKAAVAHGDSI